MSHRLLAFTAFVFVRLVVASAFENDEYGLKATIPAGFPECVARTQGHVHGVGTVLVGRDCENPQNQPAFNVWADYNAAEYPNALEALRNDKCTGSRLRWADSGEWKGALAGLRTALCRFDGPSGEVELSLAAHAWPRPKDSGLAGPYMIYSVNFSGAKTRLEQDLRVLRTFVRSIRLSKPEALSPEP